MPTEDRPRTRQTSEYEPVDSRLPPSEAKTAFVSAPQPQGTAHRRQLPRLTMTSFFDLPRHVRDKIYHLAVANIKPILPIVYDRAHGMTYPPQPMLKVHHTIEKEALPVYLSNNTFKSDTIPALWSFLRNFRRAHRKHLRKLAFDYEEHSATDTFICMERFRNLEELTIGVDEASMVRAACREKDGYPEGRLRPKDVPFQLNLLVLRHTGMDALRQIRGLKSVKFVRLSKPNREQGDLGTRCSGPIPRGVLATVVAREMMQARPPLAAKSTTSDTTSNEADGKGKGTDAVQTFNFMGLPAELRNRVYSMLLVIPGGLNPSKRHPSSHIRSGVHPKARKFHTGPAPSSCLALLQVSRQLLEEAHGVFYSLNRFIFYYPSQMQFFLLNICDKRRDCIRTITLWYNNIVEGGSNSIEMILPLLYKLKSLLELEIIVDTAGVFDDHYGPWPRKLAELQFPGHDELRHLGRREGLKIKIRSQWLDTRMWENNNREKCPWTDAENVRFKKCKNRLKGLEKELNGDDSAKLAKEDAVL